MILLGFVALMNQVFPRACTPKFVNVDMSERPGPFLFPRSPRDNPDHHDEKSENPTIDSNRSVEETSPSRWRTLLAEFGSALKWFVVGAVSGGFGVSLWLGKKRVGK